MSFRNRFLGLLLALAVCSPAAAQGIVVPNTFVNGTTADADQVNANFAALVNNALNRAGGIMTGSLQTLDVLPVTTDVSDIGTNLKKYRDAWFSRNASIGGTLGVTGATTLSSTLAAGATTITGTMSATGAGTFGSATAGTTLGIGISPIRQVHIYGVGQTVPAITDAGVTGGTLYVQSSDGAVGSGGAVCFGAGGVTNPFACLKSLLVTAAGTGGGDIVMATRATTASVALGEGMRWYQSGGVSIGTPTDPGAQGFAFSGAEIQNGIATFSIGGDVDDYTPANVTKLRVLRIDGSGSTKTVKGLFPTANQILTIVNGSATNDLIIAHQTSTTVNYRFVCPGALSKTLKPGEKVEIFYDATFGRWLVS